MQPTKLQIQLITQKIIFLSFIEISERNGSVVVTPALFDYQGPCTAHYIAAA